MPATDLEGKAPDETFGEACSRLGLRPHELTALDNEILEAMETGAERHARLKKHKQQRKRETGTSPRLEARQEVEPGT